MNQVCWLCKAHAFHERKPFKTVLLSDLSKTA
jgi:hypothetical protein